MPVRSIERVNENALRKYPFADSATCSNDACAIPSGAVVDAQIYVYGDAGDDVWLSEIDAGMRVHVACGDGELAVTAGPATPNTAMPLLHAVGASTAPCGVIVFGDDGPVRDLLSHGAQTFEPDETRFAVAATTPLGLPSVTGFRLDDGNIAYGDVQFLGTNGCDVATFTSGGRKCLMVSVLGTPPETYDNECVSAVRVVNRSQAFTVSGHPLSKFALLVSLRGANMTLGGGGYTDQSTICERVKHANGEQARAVEQYRGLKYTDRPEEGEDDADDDDDEVVELSVEPATQTDAAEQPTLHALEEPGGSILYTFVTDVWDPAERVWTSHVELTRAYAAGALLDVPAYAPDGTYRIDPVPAPTTDIGYAGARYVFIGYYDTPFRPDDPDADPGNRVFTARGYSAVTGATAERVTTLYAHWIAELDESTVNFAVDNDTAYGTLHLCADNEPGYDNPLKISGIEAEPVSVQALPGGAAAEDGGDALAERVLNPESSAGGILISVRGLDRMNA